MQRYGRLQIQLDALVVAFIDEADEASLRILAVGIVVTRAGRQGIFRAAGKFGCGFAAAELRYATHQQLLEALTQCDVVTCGARLLAQLGKAEPRQLRMSPQRLQAVAVDGHRCVGECTAVLQFPIELVEQCSELLVCASEPGGMLRLVQTSIVLTAGQMHFLCVRLDQADSGLEHRRLQFVLVQLLRCKVGGDQ